MHAATTHCLLLVLCHAKYGCNGLSIHYGIGITLGILCHSRLIGLLFHRKDSFKKRVGTWKIITCTALDAHQPWQLGSPNISTGVVPPITKNPQCFIILTLSQRHHHDDLKSKTEGQGRRLYYHCTC